MNAKKILIIDDNEDIRYTLQEICTFADFRPIVASDGKEAIQKFLEHNPDLILVDFHMPVMDGLVTVRTIREMDQKTPIIVLTVDERQQIADKFLDAGASDFALKPIKAPDIISRINVHLKLLELEIDRNNADNETEETGRTERLKAGESIETLSEILDKVIAKGISKQTLFVIAEYVSIQKKPQTIEQVSLKTGISYPTVHRYLNHLVEEKMVNTQIDYGEIGRPKNNYSWNKPSINNMD
ncbi:response regulator [Bacillaceae bacterium IKA-2]|nr:response regulator [Bacillaceae bacterium IKA-2]